MKRAQGQGTCKFTAKKGTKTYLVTYDPNINYVKDTKLLSDDIDTNTEVGIGIIKKNVKLETQCTNYKNEASYLYVKINKYCKEGEFPESDENRMAWCKKVGGDKALARNEARRQKLAGCKATIIKVLKDDDIRVPYPLAADGSGYLYYDGCSKKVSKPSDEILYNACGDAWATNICRMKGYVEAIDNERVTKDFSKGFLDTAADGAASWWLETRTACHGRCTHFTSITCRGLHE